MKHGAGASKANPSGRRRSRRGAALFAAAAAGEASSAAPFPTAGTSGKSSSSATAGDTRQHAEACGTASHGRANRTAVTRATRSSPRRPSKPTLESHAGPDATSAVPAAPRGGASSGGPSTVVSRGTTTKGNGKRTAPSSAASAAAAASTTITSLSSPSSAAAGTAGAKKRRSSGGGGGGGRADIADSDAAMKMMATLLSPVAAAREDAPAQTQQAQEGARDRRPAARRQEQDSGDSGGGSGGGEADPNPCPLEAMFLALEQVLPLFRRRRQASLLKQVRPAVEGMCGRSFTRQHLARIVHVQPDAYNLSSKTDARPTRGGYRLRDLLIEIGPSPPPEDGGDGAERDAAPTAERRGGVSGVDRNGGSTAGSRGRGSGSGGDGGGGGGGGGGGEAASARRREAFRRLLSSAKSRHCKCGRGGGGGSAGGAKGPHDGEECSCLPEATLPDTSPLPVDGIGGSRGGTDGTAVRTSSSSPLASPSEAHGRRKATAGGDDGGSARVAGPAKGHGAVGFAPGGGGGGGGGGLSGGYVEDYDVEGSDAPKSVESLRERLRQKDARSAKERNKSVLEKEADRRRKGNLPAMADAVRSYFAHSGRTTCSLEALVEALSSSSKHALSQKEARDRVRMISNLVPEWCKIIAPPAATSGGGGGGGGGRSGSVDGSRGIPGGVDDGMVARPMRAKEVVRVNTRIRFDEVRQMIAFMAEGGGGGGTS